MLKGFVGLLCETGAWLIERYGTGVDAGPSRPSKPCMKV